MDTETCPHGIETLRFVYYNKHNITEVQELENVWPCEVRTYWNSANVQKLVSTVDFLFNYATIVLIIIGLLANVYSLLVLNSPSINKLNMYVYLKALAISDMGVLIFTVGVSVLRGKSTMINDIFCDHKWMFTLHQILFSGFLYYSTWLVVIFSFERLLMIKNPFKIQTWNNQNLSKAVVIILAIATLTLATLRSLTSGFERNNSFGYKPCGGNVKGEISLHMVPIIILNIIFSTIFIIVANTCIVVHIKQASQVRNKLRGNSEQAGHLKATRMAIIISSVYVVLYLPFGIASCTEMYFGNTEPPSSEHILHMKWQKKIILMHEIRGLCEFLHLINFVNNFFLYCLSGNIFRKAVKARFPSRIQNFLESNISRNISKRWSAYITSLRRESNKNNTSTDNETQISTIVVQAEYSNAAFFIADEMTSKDEQRNNVRTNKNKKVIIYNI